MKFFDDVLKHTEEAKKQFDKNITPEDIKNAYFYGKQGAENEKELNKSGFYILH